MIQSAQAAAFLVIAAAVCLIQTAGAVTVYIAAADSSPEEKIYADLICDGIGDHIEIQEAIDSLPAGGGEVLLLSGHFRCAGDVKIRSGTVFSGRGSGTTLLDFTRGTIFLKEIGGVQIRDFTTTGSGAIWIYNSNAVSVHNVTATTDTSAHGAFWVYAQNAIVEDIEFVDCLALNCSRHGFVNNGEGSPKLVKNIRYVNCTSINSGLFERFNPWSTGFDLAENSDLEKCLVTGCLAEGAWESGFHIENRPTKTEVLIENCVSRNNGQKEKAEYGAGYLVSGDVILKNCISENNERGYYIITANTPGSPVITDCTDAGSTEGYVMKDTANILIINSSSRDASNMGISIVRSRNITLSNFTLINAASENGICRLLGLSLHESKDDHYELELQNIGGTYSCGINVEMSKNIMFSGTIVLNETAGAETPTPGTPTPGTPIARGGTHIIIGIATAYLLYNLTYKIKNRKNRDK